MNLLLFIKKKNNLKAWYQNNVNFKLLIENANIDFIYVVKREKSRDIQDVEFCTLHKKMSIILCLQICFF